MQTWEQIQKTLDYIDEQIGEQIEIESLARLASLSPFYFQRLFARLVKKPVAEYIKLRRMAKATELLRQSDRRILDVAVELGFATHEHFTRTFKGTFGVTPDEFRSSSRTYNYMTKPELALLYTIMDEGVPLITQGIVLEVNRKQLEVPIYFSGLEKKMPVQFIEGLGTESGEDELAHLWDTIHEKKATMNGLSSDGEEIGVTYSCGEEGYFIYFAGCKSQSSEAEPGYHGWALPKGNYVVCTFEAESFEGLVMDVLYKAQQYLFETWLPGHKLNTEAFCAERYGIGEQSAISMEIWLKIIE